MAPWRFPWSVIATAGICNSFAFFISSFIRTAPSRKEYSVWRWRWTKESEDIRPHYNHAASEAVKSTRERAKRISHKGHKGSQRPPDFVDLCARCVSLIPATAKE